METTHYWWNEFGPFDPCEEDERYPNPGQVVTQYRLRKDWQLKELADALQLQSARMVQFMERKQKGMNLLSRRRQLVAVLDIPPALLGLDVVRLHEPEQACWWIAEGYPPFPVGEDGYPPPGQVVRWYREQKKREQKQNPDKYRGSEERWTQVGLANALEITELAALQMEKYDKGMDSISRRRALVFLLGIPPALLGLNAQVYPPAIEMKTPATINLLTTGTPDANIISEYRTIQTGLFHEYFTNHGQDNVEKVLHWITHLRGLLPIVREDQRQEVMTLLSLYHQLLTDVARERCDYETAFFHANKAVSLAKSLQNHELIAAALLRRAEAWFERSDIAQSPADINTFLLHAKSDIEEALEYTRNAGSHIKGHVQSDAGRILACAAQSGTDTLRGMRLLDLGSTIARSSHLGDDNNFIKFNAGMYHMMRAKALIGTHSSQRALEELELAKEMTSPDMKRRHTIIVICSAQALLGMKEFSEATQLAEQALQMSGDIQSSLNIARISELYQQLRTSSYGDAPSVARLGWKLKLR